MSTQLPLNQRIDKTKLERHPSGDGWLVPMRSGEKAQVLCFERKGFQETILGLDEDSQTLGWLPDGRFIGTHEHRYDLILDAYIDPYAELKAAHAAGKVIQCRDKNNPQDIWEDCTEETGLGAPEWCEWCEYRIKPGWTLGRSVNGFTLGEGQEWHRNDFTEDMLPDGWRPLLLDECAEVGDQDELLNNWKEACGGFYTKGTIRCRTRRPLPKVKKPVPLGPEDVTPKDAFRHTKWNDGSYIVPSYVGPEGIYARMFNEAFSDWSWEDMQKNCEISRDGGKTWEACSK